MRTGQPLPPESNVDEDLQPLFEVDEDNNLVGGLPAEDASTGYTGALPSASLASVRNKMAQYQDIAKQQAAYYDRVEKELLARRIGPSKREQLLQMSAALLQPTETRGFGASLANLVPVFQQQAQQRREGVVNRAEALSNLRQAQLTEKKDLLGRELATEVKLAQLEANKGKPTWVKSVNKDTGEITMTPVFPSGSQQPDINPVDLQTLFRNPTGLPLDELKRYFDSKYGPGMADQYLGGQK